MSNVLHFPINLRATQTQRVEEYKARRGANNY
uniref:Uncharacterized protein n=1 Tax=Rhizophora mucronata TaxID=61149 RepID=A0A2P2QQG4_RHIMU